MLQGFLFQEWSKRQNAAEPQDTSYRNNTLSQRPQTQKHGNKQLRLPSAHPATPINIPGWVVLEFQSLAQLNCETTGKLLQLLIPVSQ